MFVDKAEIIVSSGKGGNGAVTFRREPYVPDGGPDGGDGGDGGDVIIAADNNLRTLMDLKYKRKYKAENGSDGMRRKKYGKKGKSLTIKVPLGTMVIDKDTGLLIKDLNAIGDSVVVAKGGKGGKGNVHFKSSTRQAPNFAESGELAQEREIILELKLISDVGLVGLPNVGKSTILSVATSARPKIANYHFTTIDPNLGIVDFVDNSFVLADIAGIIEGAHKGQGLGLTFLKHIERTKILIHVVDAAGSEGSTPLKDYRIINKELKQYDEKLEKKVKIIAANKIDLINFDDLDSDILKNYNEFIEEVKKEGKIVVPISAATNKGIKELMGIALNKLEEQKIEEQNSDTENKEIPLYDFEKYNIDSDYKNLYASVDENGTFILEGKQLTKIFNSTNFNDISSLRYLYKYIVRAGGIKKLKKLGLKEGDTIKINDFELDYTEDSEE